MSSLNKIDALIKEVKNIRKQNKDEGVSALLASLLEDLRFMRRELERADNEDESVEIIIKMRKQDLKKFKGIL